MQHWAENKRCRKRGKHLILECDRKAQGSNRDKGTVDKKPSPHVNIHRALGESNVNPKSAVRNKTYLRGWTRGWQLDPLPLAQDALACTRLPWQPSIKKTHHLQSVRQAACPLQRCEMSRMLFETNFFYICVLYGRCVRGRGGGLAVNLWLSRLNKNLPQTHTIPS